MSTQYTDADTLLLVFLRCVHEAPIRRIIRYMASKPLEYPEGTTRNRLSALVRAGKIARVGYGRYQG